MCDLKMEASQILWELFFDRSMVLGHVQELKILRSVGTMNMRAIFRKDEILNAVLEGWRCVRLNDLEDKFIPYDYCYCDFFLGQCMIDFQTLRPTWRTIIQSECDRIKAKYRM